MPYNLTAMAKRQGIRRNVTVRPIEPTQAQAQELAKLYLAVLKPWSADALLEGYTGFTTDSLSDQTSAISRAEDEITRLILEFTQGLRAWTLRVERWHRSKWAAAVKASTKVDLTLMLNASEVSETLDLFIGRNVDLVRDVSSQAKGRIADAVFRGYQERLPARDVAKSISDATGLARDRSLRIASDQTSKIAAALDRERREEAGVSLFRYRHGGKLHARPWHKARNGKVFDGKTGKEVNADGSAMAGGDIIEASDRPGMPPFCSCREQAYLTIMAELGI